MVFSEIWKRTKRLFWNVYVFAVISMVNAMFIRVTIKCSCLMIFPMIYAQNRFGTNRMGRGQLRMIYQSMGGIGALSAYLDRMRKSKIFVFASIFLILCIYYLMYLSCYQFWTFMTFNSSFSGSLNDGYFFYVNLMELGSFIFIRTRSSIKYLPKFLSIGNLMFLMYINSYIYACQFESLSVL